jgi:hypothetical protein
MAVQHEIVYYPLMTSYEDDMPPLLLRLSSILLDRSVFTRLLFQASPNVPLAGEIL